MYYLEYNHLGILSKTERYYPGDALAGIIFKYMLE